MNVGRLLDRGATVAAEHPILAAVPLATALVSIEKVQRVAGFRGFHAGFNLPFPLPVVDVWTFVAVPQQGATGPSSVPLYLLPIFVLLRGGLAAGYLGAIRDVLAGREPDFLDGVRRYGVSLVGFEVLALLAVFALALPAMASSLLLVVVLPLLLAVAYLFYGAPYLVVVDDAPLHVAMRDSYRLAVGSVAYAGYFGLFLLVGAVVSAAATVVVVNLGVVGVLGGAIAVAPLGLVLNATTVALFLSLRDEVTHRPRPDRRSPDRRPEDH